ncbi:phosphotransferase [Streptomyces sp. NPDC005708]|uniref:phosphotransferase n=1 Tax=Streptomyces sp. NPDC005708 TaxID=3154564 RepID=UPI0033D48C66
MDRIDWQHLPAAARAAVEKLIGTVTAAETAPHGVMSQLACTVHTPTRRLFLKGSRADDRQAWVYRHEARVTRVAPRSPRVLFDVDAGGWLLYGYEYIDGRYPDLAPGSNDLAPLVRTLAALSQTRWPDRVQKRPLHSRWADFLPDDVPRGLQGRALAHTDMSPHNMLVTDHGELMLLDWALACPAPAWADAALTIPRLIAAGHTPEQAEWVARQVPAYAVADPGRVTLFASTLYAAWEDWERTRPMQHRGVLTAAARDWVASRHALQL